ncbi:MAG: hypothetical protein E5X61_28360 [Mesorhizobium sp.]|nr:MAG: hypothetical protein E5X61_28360 [Mesorhizobium sp.]
MDASDGGRFLTDGDSITLNLDNLDFDVARFQALAANSAPEDLEQALVVYRGDLLDGFGLKEEPFEDWLRVERERLRAMAVAALDKLVVHYCTTNDPASCVRAATRLLAMEPLREDIHRALMRAYAVQGRLPRHRHRRQPEPASGLRSGPSRCAPRPIMSNRPEAT